MSTPLDGRIRSAAREEAAALLEKAGMPASGAAGVDVGSLQRQITDLHEHLHHLAMVNQRLEERVAALEAGPAPELDETPVRRTRRKAAGE